MAIDTAAKRRSAATTSVSWGGVSITPDASEGGSWRASSAWGYSGLSYLTEFSGTVLAAQGWSKVQPLDATWAKTQPTAAMFAKTQPADATWLKSSPADETFEKTQPTDSTWSVT